VIVSAHLVTKTAVTLGNTLHQVSVLLRLLQRIDQIVLKRVPVEHAKFSTEKLFSIVGTTAAR